MSPDATELMPITDLRTALRSVRKCVHRDDPVAALDSVLLRNPRPCAALATLLFPRWAEQWCESRLSRPERRELEAVQAHLLAWGVLRDRAIDGAGAPAHSPDLLPLLFEAQARLGRLFGSRDLFWTDYRRLIRQQVESDTWESHVTIPVRFCPALVRRLGRKAALVRWPAAAVARRLGLPHLIKRIDRALDDLLAALQLIDDVADADEDAAAGQVNAVLVAGGASARMTGAALQARILRGMPAVFAAARVRLRRLSCCPGGLGNFSQWILTRIDKAERSGVERAQARAAAAILARILEIP
jgi:hypothetical protein